MGKDLLNKTQNHKLQRERLRTLHTLKFKACCKTKDTIKKIKKKKQATNWERYLLRTELTKDYFSGYVKSCYKSERKCQTPQQKNGRKAETKNSQEEEVGWPVNIWKAAPCQQQGLGNQTEFPFIPCLFIEHLLQTRHYSSI